MPNQIHTLPMIERTLASVFLLKLSQEMPVYLACSGGRDSLSLAFACVQLKKHNIINRLPILIHINHNLQTPSKTWANLVENFAKLHRFEYHIVDLQLTKSDENTARQGRYQAFFEMIPNDGVLLLAHHADDQAETLLMRLVDGAGLSGLSAMQEWTAKYQNGKQIYLCRPFLNITRQEISDYANFYQLSYIDDPTNDSNDNVRGIIRQNIMPLLKQLNTKANVNIARSAHLLNQANQELNKNLLQKLENCLDNQLSNLPYFNILKIQNLCTLSEYDKLTIIRQFIQGDFHYPPNLATVKQVLRLCERADNDHKTQIVWQGDDKSDEKGNGVVLVRYRGRLYRFWARFWGFLLGENDDFFIIINELKKFDAPPTLIKLKKQTAQRLHIPFWFRPHIYQGNIGGRQVILTIERSFWADKGDLSDEPLPRLVILPKLG